MKKITFLCMALFLWCITLSMKAQTNVEQLQFFKEYENAVSNKTAIINSDPELYQEALTSGWFQQVATGLKNAENYANGTIGNGGGSVKSPTVGATCETAEPFCTSGGTTYPAGVNTGTAQSGPNYGCLGSQPNPAWYYMLIGTAGDIHITETNSANVDIDFILWGPFPSQNSCTSLTASKIVDCSYSPQAVEYIDLATSQVGEYYILLVTNFSNQPTNITLQQTSGSGATDCSIVNPTPPAPVAGGASSLTPTSFVANWGASATATGYYLDVAFNSSFTILVPGYNNLNVGNVTSVTVSGLSPGTSYYYRVRAYNANGTSPNSNTIVVTLPATITGPNNVCVNSTNNSYTTQSGMTGYNWNVSAGGTITGGAGTNVITVSWITAGAKTVNVTYTNTASNSASGTFNVTVNTLPVPTITGPASICVYSTGNVYSTQTGMTNYVWTVSAGGTITAGGTSTSSTVTVTWNTTGAKTVSVIYTNSNGCTAAPATVYNVTVNPLPVPTISGPASVCIYSSGNVYTTQTGMTNYVWTVSAGGTITAGGTSGSSSVTVTWSTIGAKTVSVIYTNSNGCTAATATAYNVTVNPLPLPTINSYNPEPCVGSTGNQFYTETGMTNYVWTITSGGLITAGQGTSHITVTWILTGLQTITVIYTNANGCTAVTPGIYTIVVNPFPNPAGPITGSSSVCAGANGVAYSTGPVANATSYTWTLPPGASIATGAGTTSITVNYSATATSGNITVAGTNQCGNGTSSSLSVTVNPLPAPAGTITGTASVCQGDMGVSYSVATIANATGYAWTLPTGATIATGSNTKNITVNFSASATSGVINVHGTNACGSGANSPDFNVTVNPKPPTPVITLNGMILTSSAPAGNQWYFNGTAISGATNQTYEATKSGDYYVIVTLNGCSSDPSNIINVVIIGINNLSGNILNIYPVPNDGRFAVSCIWAIEELLRLEVYNFLGVKVFETQLQPVQGKTEKTIDLRPVPDGVYTVVLRTEDNRVIRRILVHK
ncbi:MAG: T9SS type A sorting domain-containing protein [Bacteroidota bacterium]